MTHKERLTQIEIDIQQDVFMEQNMEYLLTRVRVLMEASENLHIVDHDPNNEFAVVRYDALIALYEARGEQNNIPGHPISPVEQKLREE